MKNHSKKYQESPEYHKKNRQQGDLNPQNSKQKIRQSKSELVIQDRFDTQLLRIKVNEHCKIATQVLRLTQSQLSEYMPTYEPLAQSRIKISKLMSSKSCKLIKSSEDKIYLGQTLNKKKHGEGVAIYKNQRVYEGTFINNQKSGYGAEVYSNGNIYIGNFQQNKKHGKGSFFWFSLAEIPCTKNAEVVIEHYKGSWWGGLPDGHGEHYKSNGDFYVGQFKNGLKHGRGIQNYCNGDTYEGQFVNGLPEGYGLYIWNDGSQYKGDFKQGYRNGYGIWKNKREDQTYQGHYMLDKKHGYGIYVWGNGYSYKGNYFQDLRTGDGKLFFGEKTVYDGQWVNGQRGQIFQTPLKRSKMFSATKSQNNSLLTKSTNIKSRLMNSRQRVEVKSQIQGKDKKSKQKFKVPSKSTGKKSQTYCVSFKQHQEKKHVGHRNCVPCNLLGRKQMYGNSTSKQKRGRSNQKHLN